MTHALGETMNRTEFHSYDCIMLYDKGIFANVIEVPNQFSLSKGRLFEFIIIRSALKRGSRYRRILLMVRKKQTSVL